MLFKGLVYEVSFLETFNSAYFSLTIQMGYANPGQTSHGIHMRQFSRAFVFANSADSPRIVFVNLEAAWAGGAVKREVCL